MVIHKILYIPLLVCITLVPPAQCGGNTNTEIPSSQEINQTIEQGNKFFNEGQYEKAIGQYTIAIQMKPNSAVAYYSRGKTYFHNNNQYSRAITDLNEAIHYDGNYSAAYAYRGWAYLQNGGVDQALTNFSKAIELDNSLFTALNGRAWCYTSKAQWDPSSLLLLYQKFESDAGLAMAYQTKSWNYIKQMQWEIAIQPDAQLAARQNPEAAELFCNVGFACFKKAQWDSAIADFDKSLAQDPTYNRSSWNRDWMLGKKQEWNLAISDYGKIITQVSKQSIPSMEESKSATLEFWYNNSLACYNKAIELSRNQETTKLAKAAVEYINKWREDVKEVVAPKCCGSR